MNLKKLFLFVQILCFVSISFSQEKFTISGTVSEENSNETLIGVTVVFPELNTGTTTNEYGFYSITLPEGDYQMLISYVGFVSEIKKISLLNDQIIDIKLKESNENLDEVFIKNDIEKLNIRRPQMSINALTAKSIKNIPVVLGEADVIKSITLLPGVTNAGESSSGFNVRGGAADQNLILLDEAIIYNSSHLFGFFSVFNPDAIKDLRLFKGGIPARYGGRVSSVLDIYQKEGNSKQFSMNGGLGIVASRLLAEGPIKKNVGSFLFAGRSSYAHLFLPLFDLENIAYFYDLNTKLSYKINNRNNIYLSGYFGRDVFSIADNFENTYGNALLNFRWNHLFSDKLFSNLSMIYSDYFYGLDLNFVGFVWNSGIKNFNIKYDLKHYLSDVFTMQYGLNSIYHEFNPGEIKPSTRDSGINFKKLINKYAIESSGYIDTEHRISTKLTAAYGLRFSNFIRLGQDELNSYRNDQAVVFNEDLLIYEGATPSGSESFKRSESIKTFNNLEPRISLAYQLNEEASIKISYNRLNQYLHLLSNTSSPTPLDVWAPSGKYIDPQQLDQFAVGYFKNFNSRYSIEIESFYKTIDNRIDYIDGSDLIANDAIEQVILNGKARAYGLELLLRKNEGRFNGWFAYTLSKSEQQTKGRTPVEIGINNGKWYRTPYDKTHDISFTGSYTINERWILNTNFLYQTGLPASFPNAQYSFEGLIVPNYGARNEFRLPAYHRLDVSATYKPKNWKEKTWQGEWVFGIYNIYNRRNANSISFRENMDTSRNEAIKFSLFGIVPSISYNFRF
ncbi:MAG: TonB-dependent receptor [Flavobacteriaceae bacterium]|nr:TonB-dependent receptor [Flavobacteriaceae bacterium]